MRRVPGMASDNNLCARIEAVLRTLPLQQELPEAELERRVSRTITDIAGAKCALSELLPKPGLRKVGRKKTDKEVSKLDASLTAAIAAIDALHKPALEVLADAKLGVVHSILKGTLKIVRAANTSGVPEDPERQAATQLEKALTIRLAEIFLDWTGRWPDRSEKKDSNFRNFAGEMFAAMGVAFTGSHVQAACDYVKKRRP